MTQSVMNGSAKGLHLLAKTSTQLIDYPIIQSFSLVLSGLHPCGFAMEQEGGCMGKRKERDFQDHPERRYKR
jgi:hypothetical protein